MTVYHIPFQSGQLLIIADLHYELGLDPFAMFGLGELDWKSLDAVIVAGDISDDAAEDWPAAIDFLSRYISRDRISILPGNHDYFGMPLGADDDLQRIAAAADVQFIQKTELHHGATRILACTLWTDFALFGPESVPQSMVVARSWMPDYGNIRPTKEKTVEDDDIHDWCSPEDTLALHRDHRAWLERQLGKPHFAGPEGETIVITHHGPSVATAGRLTPQSPAFHSDLGDLIGQYKPSHWYFGHSHRRLRAVQGAARQTG
jgi:3',5'-cyclic AMP phosphodiesterase CpdA